MRFKSIPDANLQTYGHPTTAQDKDGRIYDPRQGLGGYYRYGPRDLCALGKELLSRQGAEALPRIHESVFKRVANRAASSVRGGNRQRRSPLPGTESLRICCPSDRALACSGASVEYRAQAAAIDELVADASRYHGKAPDEIDASADKLISAASCQ